MPYGPFQPVVFTSFSGGLATKVEDNKIADNQSPDLQNVVFDGAGYIMPRYGQALFGVSSSSTGKITNLWTAYNLNNEEIVIRAVDPISTTCYLEYYNPQTAYWETLDTGYTRGLDFGHANYDYYNYYCNQKDYQRRWDGVCWSTSTYADSAYKMIRINTSACSALNFLSAGSVILNGEEIYYTSISSNILSGMTFTTAHNADEAIASLPTSANYGWISASSGMPKGNIMYEMDAMIFVAGSSGVSSNIVYYTASDEPMNYTISATPGGGGTARYPESLGPITGVNSFDQVLTVLKENTIRQLKFQEMADGTDGSIEIVSRNEIISAPKIGAVNNKCVAKVENDLMYVTPAGWVKSLSQTVAGVKQTNEISKIIRPTVEALNFVSASGVYYDGKYYLACAGSGVTVNDTVLVYDYDYQAWSLFKGWNVSDWVIYNNTLYYGASNERATYQALTNFDDNGGAFEAYWKSKWLDFGVPEEQKRLRSLYIEGYITTNTSIGVSCYYNGDSNTPTSKTIDGSNTDYVISTDTTTLFGSSNWGRSIFGGTGSSNSSYTLKKFRWWGQYDINSFYNMQIKVGTASPGYVWKITHIAPYLWQVPGVKTPIKSKV